MGRAMIIICSAVLISLGIVSLSTSNQGQLLTQKAAEYANEMTAKNAAHTAIQIAMQKINEDSTWADNHGASNPWVSTIDGAETVLYITTLNGPNQFFETDSIRIVSTAVFSDEFEATVSSLYLKQQFSELVPDFKSALTIATEGAQVSSDGSSSISGNTSEEWGCEADMPALTVMSDADSTAISTELAGADVNGTQTVDTDTSLSYQPTDELIARLKNSGDVTYLTSSYDGSLGTPENPGVFFIEEPTKLTGKQDVGYGIMVIRTDGSLDYEDAEDGTELTVAGNFTFHGLVIFENAYNFTGRGTPKIYGSVLVGNTEDYTGDPIDIDLSGNIHLQYDCRGENYAKKAAALAVKQNKYTRVVTFEEINS